MYLEYFGLERNPFNITPDPKLFYTGGERGAILEALLFAIRRGEGITKVVGEVGTGKTMLCRMIAQRLNGSEEVVYLANPSISPTKIIHAIAMELNINVDFQTDKAEVLHILTEFLLQQYVVGRRVVLLVEEAQGMPIETLEEIRLLSNLETDQEKLLQIVLFGQPELDLNIENVSIRQLKDRIATNIYLKEFSVSDIHEYLNHRLYHAGYRGHQVFGEEAARAIMKPSKGLVRRVNIIADKALMIAFANQRQTVKAEDIRKAAGDSGFSTIQSISNVLMDKRKLTYGGIAASIVFAFVLGMNIVKPNSPIQRTETIDIVNSDLELNPPASIEKDSKNLNVVVVDNTKDKK